MSVDDFPSLASQDPRLGGDPWVDKGPHGDAPDAIFDWTVETGWRDKIDYIALGTNGANLLSPP